MSQSADTVTMASGPSSTARPRWRFDPHRLVVLGVFTILALPLVVTLGYALAGHWGASLLPDSLTLTWFVELWATPRFQAAFVRSLLVAVGALALSLVLILPVAFLAQTRYPRLDGWMNGLILMPLPCRQWSRRWGCCNSMPAGRCPGGDAWILIPTYFTIVLPFMYRAIANSLRSIDVASLMDAARLLGAGPLQAFFLVVLPNIRVGVQIAIFLSFSFLVGEFVFANLLVGTRFETLQVYLNNMRGASGHFTSAW